MPLFNRFQAAVLVMLGFVFCLSQYLNNPHWTRAFLLVLEHQTCRGKVIGVKPKEDRPLHVVIQVNAHPYQFDSRNPLREMPPVGTEAPAYYYPNNPAIASLLPPWETLEAESGGVGLVALLFPLFFSVQYFLLHRHQAERFHAKSIVGLKPQKTVLTRSVHQIAARKLWRKP